MKQILRDCKLGLILSILLTSAIVYAVDPTGFRDIYVSGSEHIGGTGLANTKSLLELTSTSKGMLPPRMTTAQQNAISAPPEGLVLYDSTLHAPAYYNGSAWVDVNDITAMTGILGVAHGGTGLASGTSGGVLAFTASGTIASSGALTANQVVIGGGAGVVPSTLAAGSQYQSLVMGAANPAWSAVSLAQSAATTGQLLTSRGGTGQDLSASTGALSISSGTVSAGTLAAGNGGTGQTTLANAYVSLYETVSSNQYSLQYGGVAGTPTTLNGNISTTKNFLASTGNGVSTTAFGWSVIVAGDLPNHSAALITSGTLAVAQGGTNLASGTSGGILGYTASGTLASSGALTQHAIVLGGGAGATPGVLASLGTTTTLLHGAAAGDPTWSAVSMANDVTGTLAVGNGGTGQTSYTDGQLLIGNTTGNTLAKATITAGTGITVTNGSGTITIASSGATAAALNYRSLSTTDTAVAGDYIKASGASWTLTLPTAVGVSGQTIVVEHAGTSLSQKYTLNTTSSQTVGTNCATTGAACASGAYVLTTNGESVTLISDGANWQVLSHKADTPSVGYTPTISSGWTVTGGTTHFIWERHGHMIRGIGTFAYSASAANLGFVTVPANVTIDSTGLVTNTATVGGGGTAGPVIGHFHNGVGSMVNGTAVLALGSSTSNIYVVLAGAGGNGANIPSTGSAGNCGSSSWTCSVEFNVPVSDWQP